MDRLRPYLVVRMCVAERGQRAQPAGCRSWRPTSKCARCQGDAAMMIGCGPCSPEVAHRRARGRHCRPRRQSAGDERPSPARPRRRGDGRSRSWWWPAPAASQRALVAGLVPDGSTEAQRRAASRLAEAVDGMVRGHLAAERIGLVRRRPGRPTLAEVWMRSLASADPWLPPSLDPAKVRALAEVVDAWVRSATVVGSQVRLCLRVHEPVGAADWLSSCSSKTATSRASSSPWRTCSRVSHRLGRTSSRRRSRRWVGWRASLRSWPRSSMRRCRGARRSKAIRSCVFSAIGLPGSKTPASGCCCRRGGRTDRGWDCELASCARRSHLQGQAATLTTRR